MLGTLVPRGGGEEIPLLKPKLLVGRRDSCDICLQFANVSSRHCELEFINGYWQVRDLGSANGTKINGTRVDIRWVLPGDEIGFAKHFYTVNYVPLADAPVPEDHPEVQVSLLEKAGLTRDEERPASRRPRSPEPQTAAADDASAESEADVAQTPPEGSPAVRNAPAPKRSEEDKALEWLMGGD